MIRPITTKGDKRPAAVVCREHGWGVGDQIESAAGQIVQITGIGESMMLVKTIYNSGRPYSFAEREMSLYFDDWALRQGQSCVS